MSYLIAVNRSSKETEIPAWHEVFPPRSAHWRRELGPQDYPERIVGEMLDDFFVRRKSAARRKQPRKRK